MPTSGVYRGNKSRRTRLPRQIAIRASEGERETVSAREDVREKEKEAKRGKEKRGGKSEISIRYIRRIPRAVAIA